MVETNLPVIILKDVVLLPYNELRIEFATDKDKLILNTAEIYHDNHLLLVNSIDPLDEYIDINKLSKIGVLAKIKSKIELPNGLVRVVLKGIDRVEVLDYITNEYNNFEAFVIPIKEFEINENEEKALKRIALRDLNNFIENDSYMSNSVLGKVSETTNIKKFTDIIVSELPLEYNNKLKYINNIDPIYRLRHIIEDLHQELETIKLENDLEIALKNNLDEEQKNYLLREKIKVIKEELGEFDEKDKELEKLRSKLLELDAPENIIKRINDEINKYEFIPSVSPELAIVRNYIEWLLRLPWRKSTIDNYDIDNISKCLDETHYGLEEIKNRIIEYIIVRKRSKNINPPIICLYGPPGTGKTTLAKSIANALNRKFVKISVGGINDEAEIRGHRKTYMGSSPGKIIQALKKCGSNNPVMLIDEIDKLKKDYKGDPASSLLEVLDKEQNNSFVDNYIEEEFDLSNIIFILTANDLNTISPPLRDRLEIIELSSYTLFDKIKMCKDYIIPKLLKKYELEGIKFSDKVIEKIIINYTKESGARELERMIDKIFRRMLVDIEKKEEVKLNITEKVVEKYLRSPKYVNNQNDENKISGITNGLAYTSFGGEILKVSACMYKGKGEIITTGSLGEVMKESIRIGLSYIKSNLNKFDIDEKILKDKDVHIHFESGAVPKEGPSAGIAITTCLISLFKDIIVTNEISMTGEITLRGNVLPVGGIKEKIIASKINNIKKLYVPIGNKKDVEELPKQIKEDLNIVFIDNYYEIFDEVFKNDKKNIVEL